MISKNIPSCQQRCIKTLSSTTYCLINSTGTRRIDFTSHRHNSNSHNDTSFRMNYYALGGVLLSSFFTLNSEKKAKTVTQDFAKENKEIVKLISIGKQHQQRHEYQKTEFHYMKALHLAIIGGDRNVVALVQDLLANLYMRMNKLEEATKLFQNVVQNLVSSGLEKNNAAIIEITLKLATIAAHQGHDEYALICYEYAIEETRKNLQFMDKSGILPKEEEYKNQTALLGMVLDSYGRFLYAMMDLEYALKVTNEAFEISSKIYGKNDIRTMILYNDLSLIENSLGHSDKALEMANECVALVEANKKTVTFTDLATFWTNLGFLHGKVKNETEANKAFEKALGYARKSKDTDLEELVRSIISDLKA